MFAPLTSRPREPDIAPGGGRARAAAPPRDRGLIAASIGRGSEERQAERMAEAALRPEAGPPEGGRRGAAPAGPAIVAGAFGPGAALAPAARRRFEARFGADFGDVRVHAGARAGRSADALGAEAYTDGRDLVFGPGRYAPGSDGGDRLLAHELAHVAQRRRGLLPAEARLHLKPKAVRFQGEPVLDELSEGKKTLSQGDKGEAVIRISIALSELGDYSWSVPDESYDLLVNGAVETFQKRKGLEGKVVAGQMQKETFDALDGEFAGSFQVERGVIGKQTAAAPAAGTQYVGAEERKASARAISTAAKAAPGQVGDPIFVPDIPGKGTYEKRLTDLVEAKILSEYQRLGKGKAADRKDPSKRHDWTQLQTIARESQKAADAVFGRYYSAKPLLTKDVSLFDAWDDKEKQYAAGGAAFADESAAWRVEKIITTNDDVMALDRDHGALQDRDAEKIIIARVQSALAGKYRSELIETDKGWRGYEDKGKIYTQAFKGPGDPRADMWRYFGTFIHEYFHTLEHPDHEAYRNAKGPAAGGTVLREGIAEYFTRIVWDGINFDDKLRQTVEGSFHKPKEKKYDILPRSGYEELTVHARQLAGVVGIRNLAAAFFLGKVELIGRDP